MAPLNLHVPLAQRALAATAGLGLLLPCTARKAIPQAPTDPSADVAAAIAQLRMGSGLAQRERDVLLHHPVQAAPRLGAVLDDPAASEAARRGSLDLLVCMGPGAAAATQPMLRLAHGTDPLLAFRAVIALGEVGPFVPDRTALREAVQPLADTFPKNHAQEAFQRTLVRLNIDGGCDFETAARMLNSDDPFVLELAGQLLCMHGDKTVRAALAIEGVRRRQRDDAFVHTDGRRIPINPRRVEVAMNVALASIARIDPALVIAARQRLTSKHPIPELQRLAREPSTVPIFAVELLDLASGADDTTARLANELLRASGCLADGQLHLLNLSRLALKPQRRCALLVRKLQIFQRLSSTEIAELIAYSDTSAPLLSMAWLDPSAANTTRLLALEITRRMGSKARCIAPELLMAVRSAPRRVALAAHNTLVHLTPQPNNPHRQAARQHLAAVPAR